MVDSDADVGVGRRAAGRRAIAACRITAGRSTRRFMRPRRRIRRRLDAEHRSSARRCRGGCGWRTARTRACRPGRWRAGSTAAGSAAARWCRCRTSDSKLNTSCERHLAGEQLPASRSLRWRRHQRKKVCTLSRPCRYTVSLVKAAAAGHRHAAEDALRRGEAVDVALPCVEEELEHLDEVGAVAAPCRSR